ncbi:MAG: squalene/phytoene synthase family protein [Planctomycetota bacterium]
MTQSAPLADDRARAPAHGAGVAWPPGTTAQPNEVARASRSSFLGAFMLLPARRRDALAAVYAFCRVVDDAGDEAASAQLAREGLAFWSAELDAIARGEAHTPIGRGVQSAVRDFGVDLADLREVIEGVGMDADGRRYATLDELDVYCRKVASAVGLACLPVFGAASGESRRYAEQLGLALQLTNILRDLREDAREGRSYVPADRLAAHGVEVQWLRGDAAREVYAPNGPVDRLVHELASVARERFARADSLLPAVDRRALLPARVMGEVYRALLHRVERRGGRLDDARRVRVPRPVKLAILARAVLRQKLGLSG